MAQVSRQQVLTSVKGFLTSGDYSDLVITCRSDIYNVHKVVVCSRAPFFARALSFGGREAQDNKIDLPEDDPAIVKLLMQYLYEGEYETLLPLNDTAAGKSKFDRPTKAPDGNNYHYSFPHSCDSQGCGWHPRLVCPHHTCSWHTCEFTCDSFTCIECTSSYTPSLDGTAEQLLIHTKMYEMADKYDVVGLKDLSKEKFGRSCARFWNKPQFAVAAQHAFSSTPDHDNGLRDIVSMTIADRMELVKKPEIEALLVQSNGLSFRLLKQKEAEGRF